MTAQISYRLPMKFSLMSHVMAMMEEFTTTQFAFILELRCCVLL